MRILVLLFLLSPALANAQKFMIKDASITVYAGALSAHESFRFTDRLLSGRMKVYDRYVIKNDTTYYRAGIGVFRKPPIYILKDGKLLPYIHNRKPATIVRR